MFITKQKKRIAIERSLGVSKVKITISLLTSVALIVVIGSAVGSTVGFWLTEHTATQIGKETFDMTYSTWVENSNAIDKAYIQSNSPNIALSAAAGGSIVAVSTIIVFIFIVNSLRVATLKLLSKSDD